MSPSLNYLNRRSKNRQDARFGVKANTDLGQHFLVDEKVLATIVKSAELSPEDLVVEIGPGKGVLTEKLLSSVNKVLAFELDERLTMVLKIMFFQAINDDHLELVEGDFLKKASDHLAHLGEGKYKVVANIPYQITTPLLKLLLEGQLESRPSEMVLLIQDEVALRLCAPAQTGDRSYLSVLCQYYGKPEYILKVPPSAFRPSPKVNSAVIRIKILPESERSFSGASEQEFLKFVKRHFIAPRKQLKNVMAGMLGVGSEEIENKFKDLGFSVNIRAQELTLSDWIKLFGVFK